MAGTFLGFPFDEEIFLNRWGKKPDPTLTAILNSGAVVYDSTIQEMIQDRGNVFTIPFYNVLTGTPINYDGETDITDNETDGGSQTGVVFGRAIGHTARDFVKELNRLENTRKRYKQHIEELREINSLCFEVIDGFIAYNNLRYKGLLND